MTQRDGMGREEGGGFRMGNTYTPMADSCQCMANHHNTVNKSINKTEKIKIKRASHPMDRGVW